jgi:hypothetical protein
MNNRRLLLLIVLLLLAFWAGAQDADRNDCVVKASSSWGTDQGDCEIFDGFRRDNSGSFRVSLRNSCRDIMEVKIAVQESSGTWRIFPVKALVPGEECSAHACRGTGRYLYWTKRASDAGTVLPSDRDILTEYRSR